MLLLDDIHGFHFDLHNFPDQIRRLVVPLQKRIAFVRRADRRETAVIELLLALGAVSGLDLLRGVSIDEIMQLGADGAELARECGFVLMLGDDAIVADLDEALQTAVELL
jgi:hypothetical protein